MKTLARWFLLAAALLLPPSRQAGPTRVTTAGHAESQDLAEPVLVHLGLGDSVRECLSMLPMDLHIGADVILGWDWISSHDL